MKSKKDRTDAPAGWMSCGGVRVWAKPAEVRILIIDDDKPFPEALADSVRDFGHDVVEARCEQEAFELIQNADVAFLDLKIPGMSGIDFLHGNPTTTFHQGGQSVLEQVHDGAHASQINSESG